MSRRRVLTTVTLVVSVLAVARAVRPQATDPLDPLRAAPDTHKLALDNAFVRVLDVHVPPGKTEPRHRHPHGMSVYFTDWDVKVTADGAAPETRHRQAGTFVWNEAIVHTVENVGKTEGHILRIELKY
jgi:quercetin dioxygenase-like cupin family protein